MNRGIYPLGRVDNYTPFPLLGSPSSTPSIDVEPSIVADGLVLNLDAADPKSYPGSGTIWYDLSGRNNHGNLFNGPIYNTASPIHLAFDGVNDVATVPYNRSFDFAGDVPMTICIVKKLNVFYTGFPGLISHGDQIGGVGGWQLLDGHRSAGAPFSNLAFSRHRTNASFVTFIGYNYISNEQALGIMHVCCIYDPTQGQRLYVNGVLVSSNTMRAVSSRATTYSIQLLRREPAGGGTITINSNLYSCRLYNKSLSDNEVRQNYNALKRRYNLISYI